MKKDFTALDNAIIARITHGFVRFYEIWPACTSIVQGDRTKVDRAVDRRLQALKKQGRLGCLGQRWHVISAAIDVGSATIDSTTKEKS